MVSQVYESYVIPFGSGEFVMKLGTYTYHVILDNTIFILY
jgi:hypothetical protein